MSSTLTPISKNFQTYLNPRLLAILFLGFSSGLPLALTSTTLQAWFTVAKADIVTIGALTLIGQPYVYKFLWSPFLDRYVPPFLGRRRGWILIFQFFIVLSLGFMAVLDPKTTPWQIWAVALFVAFCSASQDTAYNAYCTDILKPIERGLGASYIVTSYRIAMLISGGLAMVMADHIGWRITYLLMAVLMAVEMMVTLISPEPKQEKSPLTLYEAVVEPLREFLSRPYALVILLFIVLYKLSDAFAISLSTTFLIRGLGFSLTEVGAIYKLVAMIATVLGSIVGGVLMLRLRMFWSLLLFGIMQGLAIVLFMILAMVGKSYALMVTSIFVESFCSGLGTVAFVALLMALCDHRFTATQYALLSAFSAVGRVYVGPVAGYMVKHVGWVDFFFWSIVLMIPSLMLLVWLRKRIDFEAEKVV